MLSKIKVYGRLARFLGERTFEAEITTPLHAFKFLLANFPHLERHMMEQNYCVKVGKDEINETELFNPIGQQEIKIVPVAGLGLGGGSPLLFGTTGGGALAAAAGNLGIYLALSGAAQMLTPVPKPPGVSDDPQAQNFSFSGIQNTSRAGTALPIIYGEIFTGSLVVSAGIDTVQIEGTA
jgi:predicted phage tail protein